MTVTGILTLPLHHTSHVINLSCYVFFSHFLCPNPSPLLVVENHMILPSPLSHDDDCLVIALIFFLYSLMVSLSHFFIPALQLLMILFLKRSLRNRLSTDFSPMHLRRQQLPASMVDYSSQNKLVSNLAQNVW